MKKTTLFLALSLAFSFAHAKQFLIISNIEGISKKSNITLQIDKSAINLGDSISVTWNIDGDPKNISVLGYGAVSGKSGTISFVPSLVSEIAITATINGSIVTKSIPLSVTKPSNDSCKSLFAVNPTMADGVYSLKINSQSINAYCSQGWTMVAAQYETSPVVWTGNIANYDPALASKKGFSFPSNLIPSHTDFAVGRDATPIIKIQNFAYQTGDIPRTLVTGYDNSKYYIHRDINIYFGSHNPAGTAYDFGGNGFSRTLTVELQQASNGTPAPEANLTWAYCPYYNDSVSARGFSMLGVNVSATNDSYAWTVWVR